jgi:hypothetical protein
MKAKGFKPSIVPGKSSLQTNTVVFKLKHQQSGIVWCIQALAAIQFWPVLYYEGEQNRYYHDVVKDMNVLKVIKFIESLGIDVKQIAKDAGLSRKNAPRRASLLDFIPGISDALKKVDLTTDDLDEMLADSGITYEDLLMAYLYLKTGNSRGADIEERVEAPLYLLRSYEQTLANWFLLGGFDVDYNLWGM